MTDKPKPYNAFVDEKTGRKCFKTSGGVILDLGDGIPPAIYKFFGAQQTKSKPEVPLLEKKAGKKSVFVQNPNDKGYQTELTYWALEIMNATNEFVFSYIRTSPPDDYKLPDFLETEEITPAKRKVLWIMGLLMSEEECDDLASAVISITMPDEEEVKELQDSTFQDRDNPEQADNLGDGV